MTKVNSATKLYLKSYDGHVAKLVTTLEELDVFINCAEQVAYPLGPWACPTQTRKHIEELIAEAENRRHEMFNTMTDDEYTAASVYSCCCGESYPTINGAIKCRKCYTYSEKGYCTTVWGPDNKVVWSTDDGFADNRESAAAAPIA